MSTQKTIFEKLRMIIEVNSEGVEEKNEPHFLQTVPVKVKNESSFQANVKPFFKDYIKPSSSEKDNSNLSTIFRGHPLNGQVVELDQKHALVVKLSRGGNALNDTDCSEMEQDEVEDKIQCLTMAKTSKITAWNYDLPGDDSSNTLRKALCFARLADVMSKED